MAEKNTNQTLSILERLAKIREMVEVIQKDSSGYNYKYVSEAEILSKVTAGMKKYNLSLIPTIVPSTYSVTHVKIEKPKISKNNEFYTDCSYEYMVQAEMNYRWVCNDNPESFVDIPWILVGSQSDVSQAFGSGLTYCNRYFLLKYFSVATVEDDPDNWRTKQHETEDAENITMCKNLANVLHAKVTGYLDKNDGDADVRKNVTNYLKKNLKDKNGKPTVNYFEVEDAEALMFVIEDFDKNFQKK